MTSKLYLRHDLFCGKFGPIIVKVMNGHSCTDDQNAIVSDPGQGFSEAIMKLPIILSVERNLDDRDV